MSKKVFFSEENLDRMVEQLNQFSKICGVKNVTQEIEKDVKMLHHTTNFVLYTETTLDIKLRIENSIKKPNRPCKERVFSVYFNKVMLEKLEQFDMLMPLVKYVDLSESSTQMVLRISASHYVDMFNEKAFTLIIGEHVWDKSGVNLYLPDIAKTQRFRSLENQNTYDFTDGLADKIFTYINKFIDQSDEHWLSLEKGDNDFKPNIINDLKYGGRY